uniref:Mitochondrial ATP synthase regulatory component factor B n=1 Tax=Panagrolaimus sp. PS1159 TaxID=55785 RepID=A0AC35F1T6_9BILA
MARFLIRASDSFKNKLASHEIPGLRWLIDGFNFRDMSRLKEIGPDRLAAEWIVKNGGAIKFDKLSTRFDDFNMLIRATAELDPRVPAEQVHLIEIDATDSSVSGFGCYHFEGLNHIKSVAFIRCKSFQDFGLEYMGRYVGDKLSYLTVESCPRITEYGLEHLKKFTALESLILKDLKNVHRPKETIDSIRRSLPKCDIHYS